MKMIKRLLSIFGLKRKKVAQVLSDEEMKKEAKVFVSRYGDLIEKLSHE
jgi:hypothetical protein